MCDVSDLIGDIFMSRLQQEDWIELTMTRLSWILHTAHRPTIIFFRLYHMPGTSALYEFMKQPWWWSIASKLCEDKYCFRLSRSRLGKFLGRLVSVSSRTKNRTSRSRLGLVKFWWTSRLGLGHVGLVHIPAKPQPRQRLRRFDFRAFGAHVNLDPPALKTQLRPSSAVLCVMYNRT